MSKEARGALPALSWCNVAHDHRKRVEDNLASFIGAECFYRSVGDRLLCHSGATILSGLYEGGIIPSFTLRIIIRMGLFNS